jgi:hypothetical protein
VSGIDHLRLPPVGQVRLVDRSPLVHPFYQTGTAERSTEEETGKRLHDDRAAQRATGHLALRAAAAGPIEVMPLTSRGWTVLLPGDPRCGPVGHPLIALASAMTIATVGQTVTMPTTR